VDHKKIFRAIGFSEVRLALMLLDMAENAHSETVRLQALNVATKCLGMQRVVVEGIEGVKIVFNPNLQTGEPGNRPATQPSQSPLRS